MAVYAAIALKAEQDTELAKQQAAKATTDEPEHKKRVLAAAREEIPRLKVELVHTRQVVHQTAVLEAAKVAALAKVANMDAKEVLMARAREEDLRHLVEMEGLHEY
jgi:hypothetical protein